MKKILWLGFASILAISASFAYTSTNLKNTLKNDYNSLVNSSTTLFNQYKNNINTIKTNISTWDYTILAEFTWINTDNLENNLKTNYQNLVTELTTNKYWIISQIDTNDNNLKLNIITTWEYNDNLNNIASTISWYKISSNTKIKNTFSNISWNITDFNKNLSTKLNYYKSDIEKYKNFKNKLTQTLSWFDNLESNYNKLIKNIGIWKKVLKEKNDEIKKNTLNYFSWVIEKEYSSYIQKDGNMIMYKTWMTLKKQVLLWFVSNKLNETIWNITNKYYPSIDIEKVKTDIEDLKKENAKNIVKNNNDLLNKLSSLNNQISSWNQEVTEKLNNLEKKWSIFDTLKNDIIEVLNNSSKIVLEDIKNTLKNYYKNIKNQEEIEQPIMDRVLITYNNMMISWDLQTLNTLKETLIWYKGTVSLVENLKTIDNYIKAVETKITKKKYEKIDNDVKTLTDNINKLQISNNFDEINQLSWEIKKLENEVPEEFKVRLKKAKYLLKMKENLNKLFKLWAIRYFYRYGNLTDTVEKILNKYYEKYKNNGKEKIFMDKINKWLEKINILENSLSNDKRSYYIIMIHNGFLKFKMDLLK